MVPTDKLHAMPLETLEALNRAVVEVIRHKRSLASAVKIARFAPGDTATFWHSKQGREVTVKIEKVNRTKVVAREVASHLPVWAGTRWTIPAHMLKAA